MQLEQSYRALEKVNEEIQIVSDALGYTQMRVVTIMGSNIPPEIKHEIDWYKMRLHTLLSTKENLEKEIYTPEQILAMKIAHAAKMNYMRWVEVYGNMYIDLVKSGIRDYNTLMFLLFQKGNKR